MWKAQKLAVAETTVYKPCPSYEFAIPLQTRFSSLDHLGSFCPGWVCLWPSCPLGPFLFSCQPSLGTIDNNPLQTASIPDSARQQHINLSSCFWFSLAHMTSLSLLDRTGTGLVGFEALQSWAQQAFPTPGSFLAFHVYLVWILSSPGILRSDSLN